MTEPQLLKPCIGRPGGCVHQVYKAIQRPWRVPWLRLRHTQPSRACSLSRDRPGSHGAVLFSSVYAALMARDHYLPAAVLGRFSNETTQPARKRNLFVGREGKVFSARAENFAFVNGLYDVSSTGLWSAPGKDDPRSVDPALTGYEAGLPKVLSSLEKGEQLLLQPWLRIAVPFVTAMFVRGPDFSHRFESRPVVALSGVSSRENTNRARWLEFSQLVALVVGARWVVLHTSGFEPLITNDLGLVPIFDSSLKQPGFAVPVGQRTLLGVFPQPARTVALYTGGRWRAVIEHHHLDSAGVNSLNQRIARCATEWIVGGQRALVARLVQMVGGGNIIDPLAVMEAWPFDNKTKVAHDLEWHRLISATVEDPTPAELPDLDEIVPSRLQGWMPPVPYRINMKRFPTGLSRTANGIRLVLYRPANYEDFFL